MSSHDGLEEIDKMSLVSQYASIQMYVAFCKHSVRKVSGSSGWQRVLCVQEILVAFPFSGRHSMPPPCGIKDEGPASEEKRGPNAIRVRASALIKRPWILDHWNLNRE